MMDISESKSTFEKELIGYYEMIEDGVGQLPEYEFFERGAKWYSQLDENMKKKYKKVYDAYQKANSDVPIAFG